MKTRFSLLFPILFWVMTPAFAQDADSLKIILEKERNRWNNSLTRDTAYK